MRLVTSCWIEPRDAALVETVRSYGVRELWRTTGISPSMICRWLGGHTGMSQEKADHIMEVLDWPRTEQMKYG